MVGVEETCDVYNDVFLVEPLNQKFHPYFDYPNPYFDSKSYLVLLGSHFSEYKLTKNYKETVNFTILQNLFSFFAITSKIIVQSVAVLGFAGPPKTKKLSLTFFFFLSYSKHFKP